ncbi:Kae1-associated serine/threonine protein kinase [Candidatus Micrarchaeota archaeon]|nr:Kae1-associated serine/threonine protein kinase [Candidatus Micrarchaeota archaeon]
MQLYRGAEALVTIEKDRVIKTRLAKAYRLPQLDAALRKQRSRREARLLRKLHTIIRVPKVLDETDDSLILEKIHGEPLKHHLTANRCEKAGFAVGKMHAAQLIHGDLTTSNLLVEHPGQKDEQIVLIDFGLSYPSHKTEDMATDLHVFEELVPKDCFEAFWKGYEKSQQNAQDVGTRLEKLKTRGRNKARD